MRIVSVDISNIEYTYKCYNNSLYNSILRIGFSFPIKVKIKDNKYYCIDGHKRLSVLHDIIKSNIEYKKGSKVNVVITNNGNSRSNDCWRGRNTH